MRKALFLALALLVALAPDVHAQFATGNIYGTVTDESGAVLAGAAVTLTSDLGTRTTTTSTQGEFRFLNLDRGRYKITVANAGFTTMTRDVTVTTGENVNVTFAAKVAQQEETVTVTAETPLVDTKKRGTGTTLTTEELADIPNARDPWGALRAVPGVLMDRVNIAGNENGQQAAVAGKGSESSDKMWNLDGLAITDMSATGASPTYFDFEAFNEINVSTGGNDLAVQTGGININLTTKRGTNRFHGGGRMLIAHDDFSFGNVPDELANDPRLAGNDKANHIKQISDYGAELGGPIIKDKLWFYGTYGKQDIRLITLTQTNDKTLLPSYNGKLNWQATGSTMLSAYYFLGSKQKFGRGVGYPLTETDDFLWNQDNAFTDGGLPGGLSKLQVDHTFSPNFFVSAKAAYYDTGFGLFARGGAEKSYTLDYVSGEAIGSYQDYEAIRPQKIFNLDGSYFFEAAGGNNELKFGFGYRDLSTTSVSHFNGNQLAGKINAEDDYVALVWRDGVVEYGGKYMSFYAGDVYTKNRLTLNFGARFDSQTAKNFGSEAPANASFTNAVPAVQYDGDSDNIIEWSTWSPRVGVGLALDEARRTVVRASYANYADQLSFGWVTDENPISYGYLAYRWNDRNGDRFVQPGEVDLNDFLYNNAIDPDDPGGVGSTPNRIDRDLKPKRDHELVLGLDREIGNNFAIGAAYTWRRAYDWDYRPRLGSECQGAPTRSSCRIIQPNEYTQNAASTANGYTAFTYSPPADLVTAGAGGRLRTNAEGFHTSFSGLELTLLKRLSNRWMGRIAFSWNDWTMHWDGQPYGIGMTTFGTAGSPTREERDPNVEGGQVAILSGGSGKASFYTNTKWQLYANGLVQLPWGVDLSGAMFGRQGGAYPVSLLLSGGRDGSLRALATSEVDSQRYPNLWNLDLRLAKTIKLGGAGLTLAAEWFNVMNNDVVLSRYRFANQGAFTQTVSGARPNEGLGRVEEIIVPSIFRFGARFTF
ncbi:MAG TPA: TonB-dependent receptor [Vicinamibacteria bacterium]